MPWGVCAYLDGKVLGDMDGAAVDVEEHAAEGGVAHPVFEELASSPQLLLEITRAAARIVGSPSPTVSPSPLSRPNKRPRLSASQTR